MCVSDENHHLNLLLYQLVALISKPPTWALGVQEVTDQIRTETGHLPGVSIAVMGCIVNGPGEMADADFGYVGGAPGGA